MSENNPYEVIIIGAGIIGSATSYYLSKEYGDKVVLLEQFDFLHRRGSSHGETRLTRKTYSEEHYTFLMKDAYKFWEEVENQYGSKIYTKTGGLDISSPDNEDFQSIINCAKKYNVPFEILSSEQVTQKFPPIKLPEGYVALYNVDGGILNATKAVAMFQSLARLNGCIMFDNTHVTKIEEMISMDEGNHNIIIKTSGNQIFYTKKLIITAGPWTKKLLKQTQNLDLPLTTLQTGYSYWNVNDPTAYSIDKFPIVLKYSSTVGIGVFPAREYPNMIKCGSFGGSDCDPDKRNFDPECCRIEEAYEFLQSILIGVDSKPTITESCMYTMSPDHGFIIDKIPSIKNIIIGCGFSGHGFKLAPVVGKILTELAVNGQDLYPDIAKYFKLDRFN